MKELLMTPRNNKPDRSKRYAPNSDLLSRLVSARMALAAPIRVTTATRQHHDRMVSHRGELLRASSSHAFA